MTNPLNIFHELGEIIEVRTLGTIASTGYFIDADLALKEAMKYDGKTNVYFVINQVKEACYHRKNRDKLLEKSKSTSDAEIESRKWVYLDFDPVRPADTSATEEEKQKAYDMLRKTSKYLQSKGFEMPVVADSGNGWHLLYKINMPNDNDSKLIIEQFLKVCDMLFSTDEVKIDTVVYNASRITKLYGTMAIKGANTTERPHRRSKITYVPDNIKTTSTNKITAVTELLPKPPKKNTQGFQQEFDLQEFMSKHGIRVAKTSNLGDGTKYVLEDCPFDSAHGKDAAIIQLRSGALSFHCFHNGCSYNTWKEFRELYEPSSDRKPYEKKEYKQNNYTQEKKPLIIAPAISQTLDPAIQEILNRANNLSDVKKLDRENLQSFTTGIDLLDKKVEILFGKLIVISGTNGSGKSTLLGQLMLESLEQGFNVFTYSGELLDSEFQHWIDLQAAGSKNVVKKISKKGKDYYDIKPQARDQIHQWYNDKFFLYKNNESMEFRKILDVVEAFRIHKKCNVIFLDNFLTMDISDLDDKELKAQTIFINSLARYAKETQVLIYLVIHPKKIYKGICTKGDVLGSGNLTNAIDYLFLVHRNNEAFRTSMKDRVLSNTAKDSLLQGTNILEVSKDRWTGQEGLNVPLIYYEDSKRLVDVNNTASADKEYSWVPDSSEPWR